MIGADAHAARPASATTEGGAPETELEDSCGSPPSKLAEACCRCYSCRCCCACCCAWCCCWCCGCCCCCCCFEVAGREGMPTPSWFSCRATSIHRGIQLCSLSKIVVPAPLIVRREIQRTSREHVLRAPPPPPRHAAAAFLLAHLGVRRQQNSLHARVISWVIDVPSGCFLCTVTCR